MSAINLKHDGWVVVADGEKALFLRNDGDEQFPNLQVFREIEHPNPPDREQAADRPGRLTDGGDGTHRSAVQETDWHRLEKERFAKDIADRLYKHAHAGRIPALVLVASPMVLGEIRKELHKEVGKLVSAEVDKDLTNHPVHEIEKLVLAKPSR
jgi:protein required for attachment to host cells